MRGCISRRYQKKSETVIINISVMNKTMLILSSALLLILPCRSSVAQETPQVQREVPGMLTLGQCLEMAVDNYPMIRQKGLIDASEKYDLSIAASSWIPQFSVSGKAAWQSEVVEMPFEIPGFDLKMKHDQYSVTGNLTQHLWDGGESSSKKEAVKTGAQVQRKQLEVTLYSVRSRVLNVYLGILLIDGQLKQNALHLEGLQRNREDVMAMIDNGLAYRSDLDMIDVNILDSRQQSDALNADRASYVRMLGLLLGTDVSGCRLEIPAADVLMDNSSILRPELDLYAAQLLQNEARMRQLNARINPQLDLSLQGGFGRPGLNMLKNSFEPMFIAGLKLQWNIGAFYTRKNDKRKIDSDRKNIELQRETFLFNTKLDAEQEQTAVEKARMLLEKDERIIELRTSVRQAGEEQYRNGTLGMNDLMDRIDQEHNARLARSVHHIQLLMAVYDLKNTLGQ